MLFLQGIAWIFDDHSGNTALGPANSTNRSRNFGSMYGLIVPGKTSIHVHRDSEFVNNHRRNWRDKARAAITACARRMGR